MIKKGEEEGEKGERDGRSERKRKSWRNSVRGKERRQTLS